MGNCTLNDKMIEAAKDLQEWWFFTENTSEEKSLTTEQTLKQYYAFCQIFYHNTFRNNNGDSEEIIEELIQKLEKEDEFRNCSGKEQRLRNLTLGTAYRRLGQLKKERYQNTDTEYIKANRYLEEDVSFLVGSGSCEQDDESFVITLLFLLNKAKYFRDIAEKDTLRTGANYWRAIALFGDIVNQVEEWQKKSKNNHTEENIKGVVARIYVSARLNIANVYRLQQNPQKVPTECLKLINICILSIHNNDKKQKIARILRKHLFNDKETTNPKENFSMGDLSHEDMHQWADHLFIDYILQALLQLGIFYRDLVDFNKSETGRILIKKALHIFLILGMIDRIKDSETTNEESIEKIQKAINELNESDFSLVKQEENRGFIERISEFCSKEKCAGGKDPNVIKNADSKNNIAVCMKKLGYYDASIRILEHESLSGNRFAEYNRYKCYLELGLAKKSEEIMGYCGQVGGRNAHVVNCSDEANIVNNMSDPKHSDEMDNTACDNSPNNGHNKNSIENTRNGKKSIYVYLDDFSKSNRKWLFMYARYQKAKEEYEIAAEIFQYIRSSRPIQWNSLELKAAYLESECLVNRGKNLLAIDVLTTVHNSLLKQGPDYLTKYEIRTEIARGRCLIMEDRYQEALSVYESLIIYLLSDKDADINKADNSISRTAQSNITDTSAQEDVVESLLSNLQDSLTKRQLSNVRWYDIDSKHQMEILHGLYDCRSYLERKEKANSSKLVNLKNISSETKTKKDIISKISEICDTLEKHDIEIQFLINLASLNNIKQSINTDDYQKWKSLSEEFSNVLKKRPRDIITYNCWVISMANYCMTCDDKNDIINNQLLTGVVSSTTPITMKSYVELAKLILKKKDRYLSGISGYDNGKELVRSFIKLFCHMKLMDNGTNQAFMNLMANQDFHSIPLSLRAELLAMIVELYGYILQMKNLLRVTYDDLKEIKERARRNGLMETDEPIICQYTKLSTLKAILTEKKCTIDGRIVIQEPKFRMSNAARMNDAWEGTVFRDLFERVINDKQQTYDINIIQKYIDNSSNFRIGDELSSQDSSVYIASFSMNQNNFGLWSNYADDEKGCVIGFDTSFFDFIDENHYAIMDDEAEENALYRILYVDTLGSSGGMISHHANGNNCQEHFGIVNCDDNDAQIIGFCIPQILRLVCEIEKKLSAKKDITAETATVIQSFITDRLNEIRFLFKSVSYEYEEEMRMLRCCHKPEVDESSSSPIPRLYINVEKNLHNLILILGSRVEQQQVKELSVWAKSTGKVKQVIWSGLNRIK